MNNENINKIEEPGYQVQTVAGKEYLPIDMVMTPSTGDVSSTFVNLGCIIQSTQIQHGGLFTDGHVSLRLFVPVEKLNEFQRIRLNLGV